MNSFEVAALLEQVRAGTLSVADALATMTTAESPPLNFATIDFDRSRRCGFPEVVLALGKTSDWLAEIVTRIHGAGQDCLVTRLDDAQSQHLEKCFPSAIQDRLGRTFWWPINSSGETKGHVAVVTAGTSDLPVAREAEVTARALGCVVESIPDVGVAGLHRVLDRVDGLRKADALVVAAGMDGALPSVIGGLVAVPVIAVPTSVGYGTSFGGVAALLTMLNTCSANVVVVNIDAGFKAGFVAALIARNSVKK